MDNRIILHIDFDSFFASVEQQFHPEFRNKPLGVTATNGRTCIIASSREAKRLGIQTGSRTFEAFQICPELQLTPAHFVQYFEISKKFVNICKDYSPYVELFSIDELFMDVTNSVYLFGGVEKMVAKIKERIKDEIGEYITVSVGVSHNKLLAKLGSGLQKPNGLVFIKKENIETIYSSAKLTSICGIGNRIQQRLYKLGVYKLLELRTIPLHVLVAEFGRVEGWFLKNIGWGIDTSPVVPYTEAPDVKSVGRNYCLPKNEYDERVVLQNFFELSEEVGIKLRKLHKKAKTFGFSFRGSSNFSGRKTVDQYFDTGKEMFYHGLYILKTQYRIQNKLLLPGSYIRQLSVWSTNLADSYTIPLSVFPSEQRHDKLVHVIDALNARFGNHTIRNAYLTYAPKLTTVPNGFLADRLERTEFAKDSKKLLDSLF